MTWTSPVLLALLATLVVLTRSVLMQICTFLSFSPQQQWPMGLKAPQLLMIRWKPRLPIRKVLPGGSSCKGRTPPAFLEDVAGDPSDRRQRSTSSRGCAWPRTSTGGSTRTSRGTSTKTTWRRSVTSRTRGPGRRRSSGKSFTTTGCTLATSRTGITSEKHASV